jgi:hypothetical protein
MKSGDGLIADLTWEAGKQKIYLPCSNNVDPIGENKQLKTFRNYD